MEKIKLGLLGATGMAGREAVKHQEYLEKKGSNYAELAVVTGSSSSAGRGLGEIFSRREKKLSESYSFWEPQECPEKYREKEISETDPEKVAEKADYVISALPSDVAAEVEPELRQRGVNVFSNASQFRWEKKIPLMMPEVNPSHIRRVTEQQTEGIQANNPNCTTAGFVPLINALRQSFDIRRVDVTTMQSISGKGDKVAGKDYRSHIDGNVIDDWGEGTEKINGEERKSEIEPQKILGNVSDRQEALREFEKYREGKKSRITPINARTNRVPTQYGHLEAVTVETDEDHGPEEFKEKISNWRIPKRVSGLPSTPENLFKVRDRQVEPSRDVLFEDGMGIAAGRIRRLEENRVALYTLSHNLRRGATWTARQSLELYLSEIEGYDF